MSVVAALPHPTLSPSVGRGKKSRPSTSTPTSGPQLRRARLPPGGVIERRGPRKRDGEGGPRAGGAHDGDVAAVRLHELPGDVQAQAEAAVAARRHRPLEAVEDALLVGRSD